MSITENIRQLRQEINEQVKIIAVSKFKSLEEIRNVYEAGQRRFGENKVQELVSKYPALPKDIEWHFLGHLQTNKVRFIAPFIYMIHSVDSMNLLREINKEAAKSNRLIHCLLQFHIAQEETKSGLDMPEAEEIIHDSAILLMQNISISGIMGMATLTDDLSEIKAEFIKLKGYFDHLKTAFFPENNAFREISMGMSGDYRLAIEEGSTMVRLGTAIFGERNYL